MARWARGETVAYGGEDSEGRAILQGRDALP